jgi:bacterioferritin
VERQALIDMLNEDLADEHASVVRYLIHAYQVGEDTPLGSMLLSTAREEMWHMDWLADEIGEMGAEPNMRQGLYPHDPTSNASLLRSYIEWEARLVKAYPEQAAQVDSAELSRVLRQEGSESAIHQKRFEEWLEKLGPEGEEPLIYGERGAFSPQMSKRLQDEMTGEYRLVLQHLRHAFVFEDKNCPVGSELELTAMRHMKHMSHFAEELADSGHYPQFIHPPLDMSRSIEPALGSDIELTEAARERFVELHQDPELAGHPGLQVEVEKMIIQEEFLASTVGDLLETAAEPEPSEEPQEARGPGTSGTLTVGSLIQKD